jgi:hypothetical protein
MNICHQFYLRGILFNKIKTPIELSYKNGLIRNAEDEFLGPECKVNDPLFLPSLIFNFVIKYLT